MESFFIVGYPPHPNGPAGNNQRGSDIKIAEASTIEQSESMATAMIQNYPNYHVIVCRTLRLYKLPELPIPQGFEFTEDGEVLPI